MSEYNLTLPQAMKIWRGLSKASKADARVNFDTMRNYWKRERSNYCKHGVYVGDPYGPDYMCGICEEGVSDCTVALNQARENDNCYLRHMGNELRNKFVDMADPAKLPQDGRIGLIVRTISALDKIK